MTQPTLTFQSILLYTDTLFLRARKTRAQNKSKEDANKNAAITRFLFFYHEKHHSPYSYNVS